MSDWQVTLVHAVHSNMQVFSYDIHAAKLVCRSAQSGPLYLNHILLYVGTYYKQLIASE